MSLRESLADTVRDKGRPSGVSLTPSKSSSIAMTSSSPAVSTVVPSQSSGGTGLGMAKGMGMKSSMGMGSKNGVGFPKKAGMSSGKSGIKGPTSMGKDVRGGMKKGMK